MLPTAVENPRPPVTPADGRANGVHPLQATFIAEPADRHLRLRPIAGPTDTAAPRQPSVGPARLAEADQEPTTPTGRYADHVDRWTATLRLVAPLLLVNALAVYGQIAYAYDHIAPTTWTTASRVVLAVGAAAAVESIALYVGWHAHDALILKSYTTARHLRRASYVIAAVVGSVNYTHFADGFRPTGAAIMFGLLSLVSPWLWGLHTRRVQRVQLIREDLVDDAGVEFSITRRRNFPWRSWQARRWSIDHNIRDPKVAWREYNADRMRRRAELTRAADHRPPAPTAPRSARKPTTKKKTTRRAPTTTPTAPVPTTDHLKPTGPTTPPVEKPTTTPTDGRKWAPVALRDAALLRSKHGTVGADHLPGRNELMRLHDWNAGKASDARTAYLAGADLAHTPNGDLS
jgi:hypothetical protein